MGVLGTAADGNTSLYDADLKGPAVIVIGSEGDGMGRLVRGAVRFFSVHPYARAAQFPQCLCRRSSGAV